MERGTSELLCAILYVMDKVGRNSRLPIGFIGEANRKIIGYSDHRSKIYIIECQNCGNVINGVSKTLRTPCKKCSYVKGGPRLDPREYIYYKYKYNAEKKNVLFDISFDYFCKLISGDCFYCGDAPSKKWTVDRKENNTVIYNGIDRKVNELGYTEYNCCSCCSECNYIKRERSVDELKQRVLKWLERIDKW